PRISNDPKRRIRTKEQPEAVGAEPGAEPMPMGWGERVALAKIGGERVARNAVQHQIMQGGQQLDIGVALPAIRVGVPGALSRCGQPGELVEQQRMTKQPASV